MFTQVLDLLRPYSNFLLSCSQIIEAFYGLTAGSYSSASSMLDISVWLFPFDT